MQEVEEIKIKTLRGFYFKMLQWFYIQFLSLILMVTNNRTGWLHIITRCSSSPRLSRLREVHWYSRRPRQREAIRPAVTLDSVFCSRVPLTVTNAVNWTIQHKPLISYFYLEVFILISSTCWKKAVRFGQKHGLRRLVPLKRLFHSGKLSLNIIPVSDAEKTEI